MPYGGWMQINKNTCVCVCVCVCVCRRVCRRVRRCNFCRTERTCGVGQSKDTHPRTCHPVCIHSCQLIIQFRSGCRPEAVGGGLHTIDLPADIIRYSNPTNNNKKWTIVKSRIDMERKGAAWILLVAFQQLTSAGMR